MVGLGVFYLEMMADVCLPGVVNKDFVKDRSTKDLPKCDKRAGES